MVYTPLTKVTIQASMLEDHIRGNKQIYNKFRHAKSG